MELGRLTIYSCTSLARTCTHATAFLVDAPRSVHSDQSGGVGSVSTRDVVSSSACVRSTTHQDSNSQSKYKTRVTTHKRRSFPVTSLIRVTGAGPIPSTVVVSRATSVIPLCPTVSIWITSPVVHFMTYASLINLAQRFRLFAIASNSSSWSSDVPFSAIFA